MYEFLIKNNKETQKSIKSYKKFEKPKKKEANIQVEKPIVEPKKESKKFKGLEILKMLEATL